MPVRDLHCLEQILPRHVWILVAAAGALLLVALLLFLLRRRRSEQRKAPQAHVQRHGSSWVNERRAKENETDLRSLFARLEAAGQAETRVMRCRADLLERRPLSEAQWDSPVPAAWTIFRMTPEQDSTSEFHLGLLMPVQHPQAYSAGYIERIEASGVEGLLKAFSRILGGPVPGTAITGTATGFLEFKTCIDNEKPEVIPGSLDLAEADYWIYVKIFVQDTMEFHLRLNPRQGRAEFASSEPAHGEELMRVLAATLRPSE